MTRLFNSFTRVHAWGVRTCTVYAIRMIFAEKELSDASISIRTSSKYTLHSAHSSHQNKETTCVCPSLRAYHYYYIRVVMMENLRRPIMGKQRHKMTASKAQPRSTVNSLVGSSLICVTSSCECCHLMCASQMKNQNKTIESQRFRIVVWSRRNCTKLSTSISILFENVCVCARAIFNR